jgi:phosphoribosyl-ATP pyrophosphohydrolase
LVNEALQGNEVILSDNFYSDAFVTYPPPPYTRFIQMKVSPNAYLKFGEEYALSWLSLHITAEISSHGNKVVEISQEMFDKLYPDQNSYQMTVYTTDYAYTDRVIKAIEKMGYEAVNVFRAGSTAYSEELVVEQTMLMVISLTALLVVFVVGILLIRLMMGSRKKDYEIMILLGMKRSIVDDINRRDILLNGVIAAVCTILLVNLAKLMEIPYIASAVRYYEGVDYVIYLLVIAAMLSLLYRSVKMVKKKNGRNV